MPSTTTERTPPPAPAPPQRADGAPAAAPARPGASGPTSVAPPPLAARPNRLPLIILALLVLAAVVFGLQRWSWGRTHVRTDDAQVEGRIVPVLARVAGYVADVNVRENQRVATGQLLVRLDDHEYTAKLAQAEADLRSALAVEGGGGQMGQAEAQIEAARAAVAQAEANATRARDDAARMRQLAERGVISASQLEAATANAQATEAGLDAARKQVLAAQASRTGASARVDAARAARDRAALDLSYTRITAPADGVVSRKTVEVGQYVQTGQPLLSVVPENDVWVVANFKETEIRNVRPGDRAEVKVDAYPGRTFAGHVESLSPATGARFSLLPPDNATGNFTKVVQRIPVRIRMDGPLDTVHPLRAGMSVNATVTTK